MMPPTTAPLSASVPPTVTTFRTHRTAASSAPVAAASDWMALWNPRASASPPPGAAAAATTPTPTPADASAA